MTLGGFLSRHHYTSSSFAETANDLLQRSMDRALGKVDEGMPTQV